MQLNIGNRLSLLANICTIAASVFVFYAVLHNRNTGLNKKGLVQIGSAVKLGGVEWSRSPESIVLVVKRDCQYCVASAPFYKKLYAATSGGINPPVFAVLPEAPDTGRNYVAQLGIPVDRVYRATASDLHITGTPTLMTVDNTGKVTGIWVGLIPAAKESSVLKRLAPNGPA